MKIKLSDPTLFTKAIDMVSELVLEVKIRLNEFGLSIVAIDPANVSMVALRVPKSSFDEFEAGDESIGVNLDSLKKVLKRCGKTSQLILKKNENMLEVKIEDKVKRTFTLNLIEIEGEDKEFPTHLEFSSKVEIDSTDLADSIEDCAVISDACSFVVSEENFIVETKEMNSAKAEFSRDSVQMDGSPCSSKFSLEYMQKFMKAGKAFDKATLNLSQDHPLRMDFASEVLTLSFLLAPRIETDE
jgi:proliferating cell nuclear antigen